MIMEEENLQVLKDLGLSNSQGRVYLALLRLGPDPKATAISKFAKVPRQDIYRVLEELSQIGLVEKVISRPAKFRAISSKKAISLLLKKSKDAFSKLEKDADSLSRRLFENLGKESAVSKMDSFVLITEKETIISKSLELLGSARKKVSLINPWSEVILSLDILYEALNEALNRGVNVRWILDRPQEGQQIPEGFQQLTENPKVRFRFVHDTPIVKLGIYDNEVGVALYPDSSSNLSPALFSNNPNVLVLTESYFETLWKSGKDIDH
jgi:sugar-specific transcriptional regulator TrmB